MKPLDLIILALAAYRAAALVALDDGPRYVFIKIRGWFTERAAREDRPDGMWHNLRDLVHCPYCLGVWFSILFVSVDCLNWQVVDTVLFILAIAGAQAFMQGITDANCT